MRASNQVFTGLNYYIIGDNNIITGPNCKVVGNNNTLTGPNCKADGNNNRLTGPNGRATGDNNTLTGPNCSAAGNDNTVNSGGGGGGNIVNFGSVRGFQTFNNHAVSVINGIVQDQDESISIVMGGPGGGMRGMRVIRNGIAMTSKEKKREREEEKEDQFIEGPMPKDMEEDKPAADDAATCIICLTNAPICIVNPCSHMCMCVGCSRALCFGPDDMLRKIGTQPCPKCRVPIESIKRVFLWMSVCWAEILLHEPENARAAIKTWFEQTSSEQERTGDFACAPFDEHVRCIQLESIEPEHVVVDVSSFDPIKDAFTVFYTFDDVANLLKVRGGVLYDVLVLQCKGYMRIGDVLKSQSRAFFAPYTTNPTPVLMDDKAPHFYWPHWFGEPLEYASLSSLVVTRDDFAQKMQWQRQWEKTPDNKTKPVLYFADARTHKATTMLARFVADYIEFECAHLRNTPLDPRKLRVRYDTWRFEAERQAFMSQMSRLTTEMSLLESFDFNHLTPLLQQTDIMVDGITLDHQVFYAQHHDKAAYAPEMFLNVPVEDVPRELAVKLPVYAGGRIHLPFYWECVSEWVWHKYMISMHRHYTLCRSYGMKDALLADWIKQEGDIMIRFMLKTLPGPDFVQGARRIRAIGRTRDDAGMDIADTSDLVRILPPCMRVLHEHGRFPKNHERLGYVKVLYAAGISKESIIAPLFELNERYPKDSGAQVLENRFSVSKVIDHIESIKESYKKIVWCSNVIRNTLAREADNMYCPFARQLVEEKSPLLQTSLTADIEDMCRHKCCSTVQFKAPHKLIMQALKDIQSGKPLVALPEKKKEQEENDDDDDDEEEEAFPFGRFEKDERKKQKT